MNSGIGSGREAVVLRRLEKKINIVKDKD
uniref:Uncharacterized protein n=1 Tax=Rhizophora mucronata TaxID=61149 RepID=A0A2P2NBP5_RHIMU